MLFKQGHYNGVSLYYAECTLEIESAAKWTVKIKFTTKLSVSIAVEPRQFELEGTSSTIQMGKVFELLNRSKKFSTKKLKKKIKIARGLKYMVKFRFVGAFRGDLNKNSNYRGF